MTDGVPGSENIGFSKYSIVKKSCQSDHLNSTSHKTTVEHRESPKKCLITTRRDEKNERNSDQQKSICLPKCREDMVVHKSDQRNFEIDSKKLVQSKSAEKNPSGSPRRRSDRSIDVSRGRLEGRQVKKRTRSSECKDKSERKGDSSKRRIPDKENVSSQTSSHNSGSRKRRYQSDSSSSSKRTKTTKSPQRPSEGKASSVKKYLKASPVLSIVSKPSVDMCRQKAPSTAETDISTKDNERKGKESRTLAEVDEKHNDQVMPTSLKSVITKADSETANKGETVNKAQLECTVSVNSSVVMVNTNTEVTQRDDRISADRKNRKDDTYKTEYHVDDHNIRENLGIAASGSLTDMACDIPRPDSLNSCYTWVKGDEDIECHQSLSCGVAKMDTSNPFDVTLDCKTRGKASGLDSSKSPIRTDSANGKEKKTEGQSISKISLSSSSNASVSSSLCGDRGDSLRTQINQTASKCSVLSVNATSCSSSEVSLDSCQRTTPRRDSVCTVTSTTLWESNNGVTTWVQGIEYVNGVKKYRLRMLKPGETYVSSSAESLQSSDTSSPIKMCASGPPENDSKSESLSESVEPMGGGSLTDIRKCSVLQEQIDDCPATFSPFKTPIATPSLDKLPNSDQVQSTDSSPDVKVVGSLKEFGQPENGCSIAESKGESSPKPASFNNTCKTGDSEQKSQEESARHASVNGRNSKKPDFRHSPPSSPSKQRLADSERLSSQGRGDRVRRSRQSSAIESTSGGRKDYCVTEQRQSGLNETSESLMSIPEDVYVFIGEENDTHKTNDAPVNDEHIGRGQAGLCEEREDEKVSTSRPFGGSDERGESLSDKGKRLSSPSSLHSVEKIELANGFVEESAKRSTFCSELDDGHSEIDIDDLKTHEDYLKAHEDYLSEESEIEDGELTSDSDYPIQQSPQMAAQKSPTLRSSGDQPIVDLRQKLLSGKRLGEKSSRESSCHVSSVGHSQSVRERRRSSECRHERSRSPSLRRIRGQSTKHPSRHGRHELHNQSSPNRHCNCEELMTSADSKRHRGRMRSGPSETRYRSSSPKSNPVKDRGYRTNCSSNRSSCKVSQDTDRSYCQTRSRSNSSTRSVQSHCSDVATGACHCCTRHRERSPQNCRGGRGSKRHDGERYVSRSPSPRRTHRHREEDVGHRLSPHRHNSSRPRRDQTDHSTQRSSARRPTSPDRTAHSSGRSNVSPCHTRNKDCEKVTSRRRSVDRNKMPHHCPRSERSSRRGSEEDRGRPCPPVDSGERGRNSRVKFDSHRSDKRQK